MVSCLERGVAAVGVSFELCYISGSFLERARLTISSRLKILYFNASCVQGRDGKLLGSGRGVDEMSVL